MRFDLLERDKRYACPAVCVGFFNYIERQSNMRSMVLQIGALLAALSLISALGAGVLVVFDDGFREFGVVAMVGVVGFVVAILIMRIVMDSSQGK